MNRITMRYRNLFINQKFIHQKYALENIKHELSDSFSMGTVFPVYDKIFFSYTAANYYHQS